MQNAYESLSPMDKYKILNNLSNNKATKLDNRSKSSNKASYNEYISKGSTSKNELFSPSHYDIKRLIRDSYSTPKSNIIKNYEYNIIANTFNPINEIIYLYVNNDKTNNKILENYNMIIPNKNIVKQFRKVKSVFNELATNSIETNNEVNINNNNSSSFKETYNKNIQSKKYNELNKKEKLYYLINSIEFQKALIENQKANIESLVSQINEKSASNREKQKKIFNIECKKEIVIKEKAKLKDTITNEQLKSMKLSIELNNINQKLNISKNLNIMLNNAYLQIDNSNKAFKFVEEKNNLNNKKYLVENTHSNKQNSLLNSENKENLNNKIDKECNDSNNLNCIINDLNKENIRLKKLDKNIEHKIYSYKRKINHIKNSISVLKIKKYD